MVALDPFLKDLTKSSIPGFPKTSSTINSNQAVHHNPKTANPENPFLFSSTRSSIDPFTIEKRKALYKEPALHLQSLTATLTGKASLPTERY
jgi:hypothetical protein